MESIIDDKHDNLVGRFSCKGFDTFGPFKLIGGVAKGHPDDRDLAAAVEFYKKLKETTPCRTSKDWQNRERRCCCYRSISATGKIYHTYCRSCMGRWQES